MSFRSRTRALLTILPLCAASVVGAQPQEEVVFFDEAVPAGAEYYAPSEGIAIGGDYLLRHANGALPLTTEAAFSGASAAVVSYQHVEGGTWEWRIAPPGGSSVDLTGFDSLIVYVNGPDALSGAELPRVQLADARGGHSEAYWLSTPENVQINEQLSGFQAGSTTNLSLRARLVAPRDAPARRPGFPANLRIAFADVPRDTSLAGIGAPAIPARFSVLAAPDRPLDFRFRDLNADSTLSAEGEYIEVMMPESDGSPRQGPVWRIELDAPVAPEDLVPPGEGDVYHLVVDYDALELDDDPSTWQRVSVPFSHLIGDSNVSLSEVQYVVFTNGDANEDVRTIWVDRVTAVMNDDEAFLEMVQRATFDFFWYETTPSNGMVRDRTNGNYASIAAVGFGLSAYTVGIDRGWITREEGRTRVLNTLRFLWTAPQSTATDATGYKGFFYHFLNMQTGRRSGTNELSTIDTALLIAGVLDMRMYFDGDHTEEVEIRELSDAIYERVDWAWAQARPPLISHGWFPDPQGRSNADPQTGFIVHDWRGFNEAMILYILALGSPTHPVGPEAWDAWTAGYGGQWQTHYGYSFLSFPPLFGHQYSHVWIDFRNIQDEYMRGRGIDYFENSRRATLAQRAYHIANPRGWPNYGENEWGLTASDTPTGYRARGAPPAQNDDGTIVPTAPGGSVPFAPEETIGALRHMYETYPALWGPYGFRDAYNVSQNWFAQTYLGIDQGPILLMMENYRTGAIWDRMMRHDAVRRGLVRAGFEGEPLDAEANGPEKHGLVIERYPNPVRDVLHLSLQLPEAGPIRITLFDALGRRLATLFDGVHHAGTLQLAWPTNDLAVGMYFVHVTSAAQRQTQPFVRTR